MTTCLGEVLNSFLDFAVRHEFKKSFLSCQKVTKNSFVCPSFPSDLLFHILNRDMYNTSPDSSLLYSLISLKLNFGSCTLSKQSLTWGEGVLSHLF